VDVGGGIVPFVELTRGGVEVLPHLGTVKDVLVSSGEHLRGDDLSSNGGHLIARRPDLFKEDIFAVLVLTKGGSLEVEADVSSESVSNDKRRGSQVVSAGVGMHTALEVSVSRKHGSSNKIVIDDTVLNLIGDLT